MVNTACPKGKIWKLRPSSPHATQLAHDIGLDPIGAQLLINRGLSDRDPALSFMSPRLSNLLDPMLLKDMDRAVEMVVHALEEKKKITIYGDFDADGITSTALLVKFFWALDIPVSYYIPDRFREGYGLHPQAIEMIAGEGTGLMITVDCGTANGGEISLALKRGMNVVVTDHHQVPDHFEPLCPVINPQRHDSSFPFRDLAGVGVAFFLAAAVRAALRGMGWFGADQEPDLKPYLGLVALGTVADMAPLMGQNRILVRAGLDSLIRDPGAGIRALQGVSKVETSMLTANDLAFRIAPRLNAAGRIGDPKLGVEILTTERPSLADELALKLNTMNSRRQDIERSIFDQIEEKIMEIQDLEQRRTLVISGRGWHRGVLGIVASRLREKYYRPAMVLDIEDGMAVGSGRSIAGFNLYRALSELAPLLEKFGGHRYAAGFTIRAGNIDRFAGALEGIMQSETDEEALIPTLEIDARITLPYLTEKRVRGFEVLSPFGPKNPEPLFYAGPLEVVHCRAVGENHLRWKVRQDGIVRDAIGFNLGSNHTFDQNPINMVFTPEINRWQGFEKVQLRVVDFEVALSGESKLQMPIGLELI